MNAAPVEREPVAQTIRKMIRETLETAAVAAAAWAAAWLLDRHANHALADGVMLLAWFLTFLTAWQPIAVVLERYGWESW
jgi:hypothetical protein